MIEIKNGTRQPSKIGYLATIQPRGDYFVYTGQGGIPVGIVTESVAPNATCKLAEDGIVLVYVSKPVRAGQEIRAKLVTDRQTDGLAYPVSSDKVYYSVGIAVNSGVGLVKCAVNIRIILDSTALVPYVGAISNLNLGSHSLTVGSSTNNLTISSSGDLSLNGTATMFDDLRVPMQNTAINPTKSEPAFEEFTDGLYVYKFSTTNADDESLHFVAQIPHSYKEGSDLYPHLHWSPDSTNTGNVRWQFEYIVANIDGTFASTATSETITEAADGTALKHQLAGFSAIDGTGLTISHMLICRLTRLGDSDAADTFTGNACVLEFDFHYEINSFGSREEYTK